MMLLNLMLDPYTYTGDIENWLEGYHKQNGIVENAMEKGVSIVIIKGRCMKKVLRS